MEENKEQEVIDFKKESKKINRLVGEKKYDSARKRGKMLLDSGKFTEEEGPILYSQLANIEIRDEKFKEASELIEEGLNKYPNMSESQKYLMKRQVISIKTKQGNFLEARALIDKLLNNIPEDAQFAVEEKIKLESQLLYIAVLELNRAEVMDLKEKLLSNLTGIEKVDERTKKIVEEQVEKLEELEKNKKNKMKFYERFDNGNILSIDDVEDIEESTIAKEFYKGKTSNYSRSNLYSGNIKFNQIQDLTIENSKTLAGCIFIAETCKYFGLERLGRQCIQGFKIDNSQLTKEEKELLDRAMNLLSEEQRIHGFARNNWDEIYANLEKYKQNSEETLEI